MDVLPSLQATDIGTALRRVLNIYARGGFQVSTALMDGALLGYMTYAINYRSH